MKSILALLLFVLFGASCFAQQAGFEERPLQDARQFPITVTGGDGVRHFIWEVPDVEYFHTWVLQDPDNFELRYAYAAFLNFKKEFDLLEEQLDILLTKRPDFSRGYYGKFRIYLDRGNLQRALYFLKRARKVEGAEEVPVTAQDVLDMHRAAVRYDDIGRPDYSYLLKRAHEMDPDNMNALIRYGASIRDEDIKLYEELIFRAIDLGYKTDSHTFSDILHYFAKNVTSEDYERILLKVISINEDYVGHKVFLADHYLAQGRKSEAVDYLQQVNLNGGGDPLLRRRNSSFTLRNELANVFTYELDSLLTTGGNNITYIHSTAHMLMRATDLESKERIYHAFFKKMGIDIENLNEGNIRKMRSHTARIYVDYGYLLDQLGRQQDAEKFYRYAILNSDSMLSNTYRNIGVFRGIERNKDELKKIAAKIHDRITAVKETVSTELFMRAVNGDPEPYYYTSLSFERGEPLFVKKLGEVDTTFKTYESFIDFYKYHRMFLKAEEIHKQAMKRFTDESRVYGTYIDYLVDRESRDDIPRADQIIGLYREATEKFPFFADNFTHYMINYTDMVLRSDADYLEKKLRTLIKQRPERLDYLETLSELFKKTGQVKKRGVVLAEAFELEEIENDFKLAYLEHLYEQNELDLFNKYVGRFINFKGISMYDAMYDITKWLAYSYEHEMVSETFEEIVSKFCDYDHILAHYGLFLLNQLREEEAIAAFIQALEIDDSVIQSYENDLPYYDSRNARGIPKIRGIDEAVQMRRIIEGLKKAEAALVSR